MSFAVPPGLLLSVDKHLCYGEDCANTADPAEPGGWELPRVLLWTLPMGVMVQLFKNLQLWHTDKAQVGTNCLTALMVYFLSEKKKKNYFREGGTVSDASASIIYLEIKMVVSKCLADDWVLIARFKVVYRILQCFQTNLLFLHTHSQNSQVLGWPCQQWALSSQLLWAGLVRSAHAGSSAQRHAALWKIRVPAWQSDRKLLPVQIILQS